MTLYHYPVGRSTWWAGVKSGKFPQPVKLGPKTTAWRAEDIRALIENVHRDPKPRSFVDRVQAKPSKGGNGAALGKHTELDG